MTPTIAYFVEFSHSLGHLVTLAFATRALA